MGSFIECICPNVLLVALCWLVILGIPLDALILRNFPNRNRIPGLSPMCK